MPAPRPSRSLSFAIASLLAITLPSLPLFAGNMNSYVQTNLVSDLPGVALTQDPQLVNPWGISLSSGSPFWISDNGTGVSTLYNGAGMKQGLVVTIPPPSGQSGPSAPTGQVFNGNAANFEGSHFIFATEDGTVSSWSGLTAANLRVDQSAGNSVFKGIAIDGSDLLVTDFHNGQIDVFNSSFNPITLTGNFTDPNLPAGYAPFNVANIGGKIYVTYALQDAAKHDDVSGAGNGFVDVYDANGNFIGRLVSGGALNSPWGLTVAPTGFGAFGGDLLVGNFGDGTINAYNLTTGALMGTLDDKNGNPIDNLGLWGLTFGNGGNGGAKNTLYFTAGIPGPDNVEDHGLFGSIAFTPEPSSLVLLSLGLLAVFRYRRSS